MHAHAHAKLAAACLPLALFLAAQGGSCRGGRNAANAAAVISANTGGAVTNLNRAGGGNSAMGGSVERVAKGAWGGPHIRLSVTDEGAEVEFDCAHGRFGPVVPDAQGRFSVEGTLVPEHGGPVRPGAKERSLPARYSGRVEGDRMTLTVSTADEEPVNYTLTHGGEAELTKCL